MDWVTNPEIWIGFFTLVALEIVLGIDNIIFISILAGKLPPEQRDKARKLGLMAALVSRLALLFALSWVVKLTSPFFEVFGQGISGRDLILILGGLFLLGKSVFEVHDSLEGKSGHAGGKVAASFTAVILQIMVLDIVFSLDSVITAVGMVDELGVMIAAVIVSVIVMLVASGPISRFVDRHPSIKMLALSFLVLIGVVLIAEGFEQHISKGYIYFAMAFSLLVELLNIRMRSKAGREEPVALHQRYAAEGGADDQKGGGTGSGQAGEEPTDSSQGKDQAGERTASSTAEGQVGERTGSSEGKGQAGGPVGSSGGKGQVGERIGSSEGKGQADERTDS
ncbi:Membrane protein TerC, possibly involved in tellurium resistance [Streptosporangium subroseum]|uniref:Membrane protein TerC, possibly involved in tellurium resistance n=1 Tax=Streptosporangium subroseum TaxID=106412 RepID=A0A239NWA1_9ACTN|nr:TerC family protein [Streptosporangium subroseum]SNT58389.1 Membrane protein TerC, possibly involved in tellurium resistance [Streptosporangium subroseum]